MDPSWPSLPFPGSSGQVTVHGKSLTGPRFGHAQNVFQFRKMLQFGFLFRRQRTLFCQSKQFERPFSVAAEGWSSETNWALFRRHRSPPFPDKMGGFAMGSF